MTTNFLSSKSIGSIILGNNASTNNQPQIGYTQVSSGSTTNYGMIGFGTGATTTLCWTAGRSVGIGTASPISQLTIWNQTTLNTSPNISLVGYSSTAGYGPGINFYCWISAVTPQARIEAYDDDSYGAWMTFSTKIDGGGSNALRESMRLGGANGYVGIGTNAPAYTLDVNGNARVTGNVNITGVAYTTSGSRSGNTTYNIPLPGSNQVFMFTVNNLGIGQSGFINGIVFKGNFGQYTCTTLSVGGSSGLTATLNYDNTALYITLNNTVAIYYYFLLLG